MGAATLLLGLILFTWGCSGGEQKKATPPPPLVTASKPVAQKFADFEEYTGRIEPGESVELKARVGGFLNKINFEDGAQVKAGDLLFEIDPRTYEAAAKQRQAALEQAKAAETLAKANLERGKNLVDQGVISPQEFDVTSAQAVQATAEVAAAQAGLDAANLDLSFTKITAPITGKISASNLDVGNLVVPGTGGAGTLLATIVSQEPMYAYFDIDENALLGHMKNRPAQQPDTDPQSIKSRNIVVSLARGDSPNFDIKGVLDYVDPAVNSDTGTIRVRAVFDNKDRELVAGLFVRVRVSSEKAEDALMLPIRAIGTDQDRKFVYVIDDAGAAQYRPVSLGKQLDGMVVITEGLQASDTVVIDGILKIRPGVKPEVQPADLGGNTKDGAEK